MSGIDFTLGALVILVVLKLFKVISWSWIWVLSPLWIPAVVAVLYAIMFILFDR